MTHDMTTGSITGGLLRFAMPLMLGNLLQQFYNIADTWVVGRFLGADALASVGSAYTLMVFLTSILLGLCIGSGAFFSILFGRKDEERLKHSIFLSFCLIGAVTLLLTGLVFAGLDLILRLLQVPVELTVLMRSYLWVIFWGIPATFLYNYFANLLRSVGNSVLSSACWSASSPVPCCRSLSIPVKHRFSMPVYSTSGSKAPAISASVCYFCSMVIIGPSTAPGCPSF